MQGRKHTSGLWNLMKEVEDSEQAIGLLEVLLGCRTFAAEKPINLNATKQLTT